jgi:Fur family iron response transcriptional regulator
MGRHDARTLLEEHGIQPSAHRIAVADYVLHTDEHPSADQVWARVKASFPMISRATVYNTLSVFVEKGLLRELTLAEGKQVYDPNLDRHHHFVDETSGRILDVPWDSVRVPPPDLDGLEVREYSVVMRGRVRA